MLLENEGKMSVLYVHEWMDDGWQPDRVAILDRSSILKMALSSLRPE